MGVGVSSKLDGDPPDWLIRYGSCAKIPKKPNVGVLNAMAALAAQRNRIHHVTTLREAGVPVPMLWTKPPSPAVFPTTVLGRSLKSGDGAQTCKGQGIVPYKAGEIVDKHDFYVEFIPKTYEFRVDVVGASTRVRQLTPANKNAVAWNTDGKFDHPTVPVPLAAEAQAVAAVKALDLTFGAVDVIVDTTYVTARVRVLEVNTAPELTKPTLEWYARQLGRAVGIPFSQMPGHDAVDWTEAKEEL